MRHKNSHNRPKARSLLLSVSPVILAFLVCAPLAWLLIGGLLPTAPTTIGQANEATQIAAVQSHEIWQHLIHFLLGEALANTALLLVLTGIGVVAIGVPLAWLTTRFAFPGRQFFSWGLALPLAIPAYVLAIVYLRLLDWSGPIPTWLRAHFGSAAELPAVRSLGGCAAVMILALYPYVYITARNCFKRQGTQLYEAARLLGCTPLRTFFVVILPSSARWWLGGLFLALMEVLADFGTISAFNVATLTSLIYKVWVNLFQLTVASQLALLLLFLGGLLAWIKILIEKKHRGTEMNFPAPPWQLKGKLAWMATGICALVFFLSFALPIWQLFYWSINHWGKFSVPTMFALGKNSFLLGLSVALLAVFAAFWLGISARYVRSRPNQFFISLAGMGYAVPGLVLATAFAALVNTIVVRMGLLWPPILQLLQGSIWVLLLGLLARFLAVAQQPMQGAFQSISLYQEEAASVLGLSIARVWRALHLPLLTPTFWGAGLMVLVDVMKEIPLTLTLRPFDWDTLAVQVFQYTSEGMWEAAAVPGLIIALIGLAAVWLMLRQE